MDPYYPGFLWVDPTQTHFWYGSGGTKTPLHFDPISLFHTHITGKKVRTRVAIMPSNVWIILQL